MTEENKSIDKYTLSNYEQLSVLEFKKQSNPLKRIQSILILHDGRLAVGSNHVLIYDLNSLEVDLKIEFASFNKYNQNIVNDLCQLRDDTFIVSLQSTLIHIYQLYKHKYRKIQAIRCYEPFFFFKTNGFEGYLKTIQLTNDDIAVSVRGYGIVLYKKFDNKEEFSPFMLLQVKRAYNNQKKEYVYNLLQTQHHELCCVYSNEKYIRFFDLNNRNIVSEIEINSLKDIQNMYLMNSTDMIIAQQNGIKVIDVIRHEIVNNINIFNNFIVKMVRMNRDEIIISEIYKKNLIRYYYDKDEKTLKKKDEIKNILPVLNKNNNNNTREKKCIKQIEFMNKSNTMINLVSNYDQDYIVICKNMKH